MDRASFGKQIESVSISWYWLNFVNTSAPTLPYNRFLGGNYALTIPVLSMTNAVLI